MILKLSSSDIEPILRALDSLTEDTAIPKNVRFSITKAKNRLKAQGDAVAVLTTSMHALEEVVNDINMPMHGRTIIWNILSEMEQMKEQARN